MGEFTYVSYDESQALRIANNAVDLLIEVMLKDGLITEANAEKADKYGVVFASKSWIRANWQKLFGLKDGTVTVLIVKRGL